MKSELEKFQEQVRKELSGDDNEEMRNNLVLWSTKASRLKLEKAQLEQEKQVLLAKLKTEVETGEARADMVHSLQEQVAKLETRVAIAQFSPSIKQRPRSYKKAKDSVKSNQ